MVMSTEHITYIPVSRLCQLNISLIFRSHGYVDQTHHLHPGPTLMSTEHITYIPVPRSCQPNTSLTFWSHGYVDWTHHLYSGPMVMSTKNINYIPVPQLCQPNTSLTFSSVKTALTPVSHENAGNTFLWNNRNYSHKNLAEHCTFICSVKYPCNITATMLAKHPLAKLRLKKNFARPCPMTELPLATLKQLGLLPESDSNTAPWFNFPHSMFNGRQQQEHQNVVCFLLGNSPASEFYMPFRNTLSVPSSWVGRCEEQLGLRMLGYLYGKRFGSKIAWAKPFPV